MNDPRFWFGPKTYGFGWTAKTWEGWVAIGLFGVVCVVAAKLLN